MDGDGGEKNKGAYGRLPKEKRAQLPLKHHVNSHLLDEGSTLHSFAAQVMLMREPGRLYMITAPVDGMRQMLQKALPKDAFAGSTLTQAEALLPERQSEALRVLKEEARLEEAHKGNYEKRIRLRDQLDHLKYGAKPEAGPIATMEGELAALSGKAGTTTRREESKEGRPGRDERKE